MISTPSVFIVDDEEPIRYAFEVLLRTRGINARSFSSAEEFLCSYREDWRGCLFADVRMPNMNGIELCRLLRERNASLSVVLMTGRESAAAIKDSLGAEIEVLEKPFSAEHVLATIQRLAESQDQDQK